MSSLEKKEEVPVMQLSFVFGNNVVKPQTPRIRLEDAEPEELPECYSTETLCLSRTKLQHVAGNVLKRITLKYLYLEGNQISSIPDSLFISLPNLLWLDLRNNQIASLPAEIGSHRSLKTLLLEGNPISELPLELGNVITLKGLNLRNCPISLPPQNIVNQGLQSILQYLRGAMAHRPVSTRKTPTELPVVEKLQLSELTETSMEEQDESVDEVELQKFRELKDKMIMLDKAELGSVAQGQRKTKSRLLSVNKREATTKLGIIPALPLFDTPRSEERRPPAIKELKEKQPLLEQRKKSKEALRTWCAQAKTTQGKKISEHKQKEHKTQRKQEEAETDSNSGVEMSVTGCEETRSARKLERQISACVEKMQERRRNPKGTTTEQMAQAEKDVEELRKLQARLLERRKNVRKDPDNGFIIITGDTWQSYHDN